MGHAGVRGGQTGCVASTAMATGSAQPRQHAVLCSPSCSAKTSEGAQDLAQTVLALFCKLKTCGCSKHSAHQRLLLQPRGGQPCC